MIDFYLIYDNLPYLFRGAWVSLQIAALACAIGFTLGTLFGLMQSSRNFFLRLFVTIYTTLVRGTPMLIQIFVVFYVLPQFGITIPKFWAAVTAIGLNSAAYMSQIIRSGIASVGKGQLEAAKVLGLSNLQITRYILLPQAFIVVLPALGNELITLIKDSSLASIIGVDELTKEGSIIRNRTYDAITVFFAVALVYLLITTTLSLCLTVLEKRMGRHAKN